MCKVVTPEYETTLLAIENEDISEIERAQKRMEYKTAVIDQLNKRQLSNTRTLKNLNLDANNEASLSELGRLTEEDVQLAAAMESLAAEANHITALKAAFEIENKAIIESDQVFSKKLQDQLNLGDQYLSALNAFETQQREAMRAAAPTERESYEIELQAIAEQRQIVEAKQVAYRHDLELTASAADPVEQEILTDSVAAVTTDELNPLAENAQDANENPLRVEEAQPTEVTVGTASSTTATEATANGSAEISTSEITPAQATTLATVAPEEATAVTQGAAAEVGATAADSPASQTASTTTANAEQAPAASETDLNSTTAEIPTTTTLEQAPVSETQKTEQEAKQIKEMFAAKEEVKSIFAYETKMFEDLVVKQCSSQQP
jgi:hypothetical protein